MEVTIKGTADEIAAIVVGLQERRGQEIVMSPENLIRAIVRSTTDDTQPDRSL